MSGTLPCRGRRTTRVHRSAAADHRVGQLGDVRLFSMTENQFWPDALRLDAETLKSIPMRTLQLSDGSIYDRRAASSRSGGVIDPTVSPARRSPTRRTAAQRRQGAGNVILPSTPAKAIASPFRRLQRSNPDKSIRIVSSGRQGQASTISDRGREDLERLEYRLQVAPRTGRRDQPRA